MFNQWCFLDTHNVSMSGGCSIAMFHEFFRTPTLGSSTRDDLLGLVKFCARSPNRPWSKVGRPSKHQIIESLNKVGMKNKKNGEQKTKSSNFEKQKRKTKKITQLPLWNSDPACRSNNANSTSWPPMRAEARRTEPSRMWPIWTWASAKFRRNTWATLGYWCVNFWILGMRWRWWIFWDLYDLYGSVLFPQVPQFRKTYGGMSLARAARPKRKGRQRCWGPGGRIQQGWNDWGWWLGLESDWKAEFFLALLSIALKRV